MEFHQGTLGFVRICGDHIVQLPTGKVQHGVRSQENHLEDLEVKVGKPKQGSGLGSICCPFLSFATVLTVLVGLMVNP